MTNQPPQRRDYDAVLGKQNSPHGALVSQLDLMIRARYPLLYIVAAEEEPVEEVLERVAEHSTPKRQLLMWDIVRGWNDNGDGKGSVMAALNRIAKASDGMMFVMRDLHPILKTPHTKENAPVIRELKNLTRELKQSSWE